MHSSQKRVSVIAFAIGVFAGLVLIATGLASQPAAAAAEVRTIHLHQQAPPAQPADVVAPVHAGHDEVNQF